MIEIALHSIKQELETYLRVKLDLAPSEQKIHLGPLVDGGGGGLSFNRNLLAMTLVHMQEERLLKNAPPATRVMPSGAIAHRPPDIKLILYLMFSANCANYSESLKLISLVVAFFQMKGAFDASNTPSLTEPVERLSADMMSMDFEQLNLLWGTLGTSYLPSVVYQIRLVPVRDDADKGERPPVKQIGMTGGGR
ncbi:MAG: DUF4255 domain-containing protein [Acidobacteriota bacterium]|nr:DUF4255 domain-containing protein [Acidobacteriota bacterium]